MSRPVTIAAAVTRKRGRITGPSLPSICSRPASMFHQLVKGTRGRESLHVPGRSNSLGKFSTELFMGINHGHSVLQSNEDRNPYTINLTPSRVHRATLAVLWRTQRFFLRTGHPSATLSVDLQERTRSRSLTPGATHRPPPHQRMTGHPNHLFRHPGVPLS